MVSKFFFNKIIIEYISNELKFWERDFLPFKNKKPNDILTLDAPLSIVTIKRKFE